MIEGAVEDGRQHRQPGVAELSAPLVMLAGLARQSGLASATLAPSGAGELVLLVFEGAIRKWVFPSSRDLIYFAKDLLLLGAYLSYFRSRVYERRRGGQAPLLTLAFFGASAIFNLFEIFNPQLPNIPGRRARVQSPTASHSAPLHPPVRLSRRRRAQALPAQVRPPRDPIGDARRSPVLSPASTRSTPSARSNDMGESIITFGSSGFECASARSQGPRGPAVPLWSRASWTLLGTSALSGSARFRSICCRSWWRSRSPAACCLQRWRAGSGRPTWSDCW